MSQVNAAVADPASVDAAIENRFSARAFLPTPVPRETLEDILRVARRAPSGTNAQPWKVYVLQGAKKDELVQKVCAAHDELRQHPELETKYRADYDYYPRHWVDPYLARRRQNGWSLYGLLGIGTSLVEQCVAFSREAGYQTLRLWTQSVLESARRIYAAHGFEMVETAPHRSFGHDLIGEYWELALQ